jgi:DNA ligase-1
MRGTGEPDVRLFVFDYFGPIALRDGWTFFERQRYVAQQILAYKIAQGNGARVVAVKRQMIRSAEELAAYETRQLVLGYEGIILNDPAGLYKQGRSTLNEQLFIKVKQFDDCEVEVIGFVPKMRNDNVATKDERGYTKRSSHKAGKVAEETLGAAKVRAINGKFKGKEFEVGTGWTADERLFIWQHQAQHLKRIAKIRFALTGNEEVPRWPVFVSWRDRADVLRR